MPKQIISPTPIFDFKGLDERRTFNSDPHTTSSLLNVIVRNGEVLGRKGIDEFDGILTAESDTPIIQHGAYYRSKTQATNVLRFTPLGVKVWNDGGNSWDDITGTALTGDSNTRVQTATIGELDMFTFTNEGHDRPRKYIGSGNTATLGGTPPYAKALEYYVGFLGIGNVSDDGVTFSPLELVLSDDPDNTWVECNEADVFVTHLFLDESPGDIIALKVLGLDLLAYKSDAIVAVRFTGGVTRFHRRKLDFPMGILAPLSLQSLGGSRHIFLAQDRNLYLSDGQTVEPLPVRVQRSLNDVMAATKAPYVRSYVDIDNETYHLLYQQAGSTYFDGRLSYNYRTQEFYKGTFPVEFNAALGFRASPTTAWRCIASTSTLTYELETGTDDNGTALSRYYDMDWSDFGVPGTKYLTGAEMTFAKARDCRVKISVAVDRSSKFQYGRWFDLRGSDPDETVTRVSYNIPSPVYGTYFKVRIEMFHGGSTNVVKMLDFAPELIRLQAASVDTPSLSTPSRI